MKKSLKATQARERLLKLLDEDSLNQMRAAHEEARAGRVYRMKGAPTVQRLVELARKKGILKRNGD